MICRTWAALVAVVMVAGCGRIGFDFQDSDDGGAGVDGGPALDGGPGVDGSPGDDGGATDGGGGMLDGEVGGDSGSPLDPTSCDDVNAGAAFCDGYEDPELAAWTYSVERSGTTEHTTERAHRGTGSLVCRTDGGDFIKEARYATRAFGEVSSGHLWFRAYYLPSTVDLNQRFSMLALTEGRPPHDGMQLLVDADSTDVFISASETLREGTLTMPRDRWVCVEYHVVVDDVAGVAELYLDGARSAQATGLDTLPDRPLELAEVGIHYSAVGQAAVTLYVDEAVLDTRRAGCD